MADSLKTGNKNAKRAGRTARYAITQESADVAGQAGVDFAESELAASAALVDLIGILRPLSGLQTPEAVEQWRHLRGAFVTSYAATMGCEAESAGRAWTRAVRKMADMLAADEQPALVKPQTPEAAALAAKRKAEAKPEAAAPEAEAEDASPKAGEGTAAAARVTMELTPIEAHIIALIRAGKRAEAEDAIESLAV